MKREEKLTHQATNVDVRDPTWDRLYTVGGAAGLIVAALLVLEFIIFIIWPQPNWPQPNSVLDWFTLFQRNRLIGLLDMDLVGVVAYILLIPTLLALYVTLRRVSASFTAIATVLFFVGIAMYFATNTLFSMLALSDQYAAATTDAQRSMTLAAGQALLTMFYVTAFQESYVIVSVALLIISIVMLRGAVFTKATAYVGILANASAIGTVLVGQFALVPSAILAFISVVLLALWFFFIGRRLLRLGRLESRREAIY